MITLSQVKRNPQILRFIRETEKTLAELSYTDHGLRHSTVVADRALAISKEVGLTKEETRLSAIAGFCHDMANFLGRENHNYYGALLFHQVFQKKATPKELVRIMGAIAKHDEKEGNIRFTDLIAAIVVLADKADVHRSRVIVKEMEDIKADIHDRVNYATTSSHLKIDKKKKKITLNLRIDTNFVPIMEYFEIFTDRMVYCRKAAEYLGYNFGLIINKFRLL